MDSNDSRKQRMMQVARELGAELRREARGRWDGVRTAQRNERGTHVWRFRSGAGDRFLHVEHGAMVRGRDAASRLLQRLQAGRWLDRLQQGPETALLLSRDGDLAPYARS